MKFKCLLFELQILKKFLKSCFTKNPYLKLVLFSRNVCIWWSLIKSWNFRKFNIPSRIEKEWPGISFRRIWIFDTMCCGFNNTIWKVTHHITNIHDKNVLFGFYLNPFAFWILILALNKKIHLPSYWHHLRLDSITENRPWLPNRLFDPDSKLSKILGQCVHRRPSLLLELEDNKVWVKSMLVPYFGAIFSHKLWVINVEKRKIPFPGWI